MENEYEPRYSKGDSVLVSHKYKFKEAVILNVVVDDKHALRTGCRVTEFYVFYRVRFHVLGFPLSIWVRGEDVRGPLAK